MPTITHLLRDEHKELLPHIEHLREAADAVGELGHEALRRRLESVHVFLVHHLIPHAEAEDKALYAQLDRITGAPQATATMSRDHVEVDRLTAELIALRMRVEAGEATAALQKDLRRVLYGLYYLIKVHFAKEEEIFLPLLEAQMTEAEAQQACTQIHEYAFDIRTHH